MTDTVIAHGTGPTVTTIITKDIIPGAGRAPIHTSLSRLWCPQHGDLAKQMLLDLVNGAQRTIDIGIYGFAWKPLVDALLAAHARGIKIRIVFDRTQSAGVGERDYVAEIAAAGIEHYIGTSPRHQIRHTKDVVADGLRGEMGSLNYSETGFAQNNTTEFFEDAGLAAYIIADLEDNIAWLIANEPQWQPAQEAVTKVTIQATGPVSVDVTASAVEDASPSRPSPTR